MKRIIKIKSVTVKSILIVITCSLILMAIAAPIVQNITFNTLKPLLVNHLTMKTGKSAALMSNFLGFSNPAMYKRTLNKDFLSLVNEYSSNIYNKNEFSQLIAEQVTPYETTVDISDSESFTYTNYPAVYIEGKGLFCSEDIKKSAEELISSNWFQGYKKNRNSELLYHPIIEFDNNGVHQQYFVYIFSNRANFSFLADQESNTTCYNMLFTDFSELMALWQDVLGLGIQDFAFVGKDSDIIYQNLDNSKIDFDWMQNNLTSDRQHHVVTYEDGDEVFYSVLVSYESEGLRFVMRVTKDNFLDLYKNSFIIVQIVFLFFVIIFVLIVIFILKRIFKRLTIVTEKMAVVQNGNYNVKLHDNSEDEIGQLAATFNTMTDKIQDDIDHLLEQEKREKTLQYNLMVSAVDPHFIYNTLNTITRLAELGRIKDVVEVNDALINFMKDNLKMKSYHAYDTVNNEREILQQYIKIQNYLCDNTIRLKFDVSPDDLQLEIPKFLLQPIVENAIIHGILLNVDSNGKLIDGKIDVSIIKKEKKLEIIVKDNGIGMTQETIEKYFYSDEKILLEEDTYFEHIGVLNIKTRLTYLYDDNYTLEVISNPNQGTKVIIQIPI